jgi:hypothetical protein
MRNQAGVGSFLFLDAELNLTYNFDWSLFSLSWIRKNMDAFLTT